MSFSEKIVLHLTRIVFAAFILFFVAVSVEQPLAALLSGLIGWLAAVIFEHPRIPY